MPEIVYEGNNEQFLQKNTEQFYLMQKIDFMNVVSRFEYIVNMMRLDKILLMQKQYLSMRKNRFEYCEIETLKSIQILCLNFENKISLGVL